MSLMVIFLSESSPEMDGVDAFRNRVGLLHHQALKGLSWNRRRNEDGGCNSDGRRQQT